MSEFSDAFLARAREALSGAESEFVNKRYNNVANRAYYACFQAAIAALDRAQIRPSRGTSEWSHEFVQGQFVGVLIGRRKAYSSAYVDSLGHTRSLRTQADYKEAPVSQTQAYRALRRSRSFVAAIEAGGETLTMSTDEQLPAMIEPNEDDPRIKAALEELQRMILERYPDVRFRVEKGADLDAIWLVAIADVDDLDEVTDLVISRTVDMQVNEGLPVYVVGNWPPERVREYLRRQPPLPPIDPADPFPILSA